MKDLFGQAWEHLFDLADRPPAACGMSTRRETPCSPSRQPAGRLRHRADVQLSADGEAMVFHDATLER